MTLHNIFSRLRKQNKGQYLMLAFCICLSVLLVTSYALMYLGPTVQNFLPQGGDTRKMASFLLAVTLVGCLVFTLYASGLFFRYKSREYGVMLALGTPKKALKPLLFRELSALTVVSAAVGLVLSVPVSFCIWKLFETFLISTEDMEYHFGGKGFIIGILFCVILALFLFFYGMRFIRKTNIMDILHENQKTEMVKIIPAWTGRLGIILIIAGILSGMGLPQLMVWAFHVKASALFNLFFLLSLAGVYLVMLNAVSQNKAGCHKEKYYRNLVSISMMRFHAKAMTKNMCVMALLLFCCLFAAFFGMLYATLNGTSAADNTKAFTLHFPVLEKQMTEEDILALAGKYGVSVTGYNENEVSNLVVSYRYTDLTDDNKYITVDGKEARLCLFFSEESFEKLSGMNISVEPGTYKTITPTDYKESIWDSMDGLYAVLNPDTGRTHELVYSGSTEFNALSDMSSPYAYILADQDYRNITESLDDQYKEKVISFDVKDFEQSYEFARALQKEYIRHASRLSDYMGNYDAWEEKNADKKGETYGYAGSIGLTGEMKQVPDDWKYEPRFTILHQQDFLQNISVYIMLCLYIFIIMLASVAIMCYVRGITIASDNIDVFQSLTKLGASPDYIRNILKKQMRNIFQYPAVTGFGISLIFAFCMSFFNDRRITPNEWITLGNLLLLIIGIAVFLILMYKITFRRAEKIIGIHE